jgi:RNA polymerase sigma factor (sigma-70 family)
VADPRTDDQLLRASASDPDAFAVFYRRHSGAILAYARRRTGDMEAAADLTANVFAAAFASRRRYRSNGEPGRAWLFGIANNLLAMQRRTQRRAASARRKLGVEALGFHDEDLQRAEAVIGSRPESQLVAALVAGLAPEQRTAVLARIVDERPYTEIATEQGCRESVVRQRVSRGLARIAIAFEREQE